MVENATPLGASESQGRGDEGRRLLENQGLKVIHTAKTEAVKGRRSNSTFKKSLSNEPLGLDN